jgi:hypothetical protein
LYILERTDTSEGNDWRNPEMIGSARGNVVLT